MIDFERSAQRDNPELVICSKQSHFQSQINQLNSITKELIIITGQPSCSADDEDCIATVSNTCNYFNFNDLPPVADELTYESSGSGSMLRSGGSGSEPTDIDDGDNSGACDRNNTLGKEMKCIWQALNQCTKHIGKFGNRIHIATSRHMGRSGDFH